MGSLKRDVTKGKKPKKNIKPTEKKTKKRKKKSSGRVEAYTFGEAQRTKDWPYTTGSLGR